MIETEIEKEVIILYIGAKGKEKRKQPGRIMILWDLP
jgi:hypothetical protein